MKIRTIKNIAIYSLEEYCYSKFSYLVIFFIMLLSYISILVGIMAVDEEEKVLSDFFISITQISLLIYSLFVSSTAIQNDIDTKRIYLIMSKPVSVSDYILGRVFGLFFANFVLLLFINLVCGLLFVIKGYLFKANYFIMLFNLYLKISVISSISVLLSSITTSSFTSIAISIMIWFIGHFMSEIKYAMEKLKGWEKLLKYIVYIFPNFSHSVSKISLEYTLYLIIYISITLFLSILSFKKKEF